MDEARAELGRFVGADPDALALVSNATTGVNTVLRSLSFSPGDEILVADQEYNASQNAARFVAERSGASVVVAHVPFPLSDPAEVTRAFLERVTDRTRLALVDHVVSTTGLVFPIQDVVRGLDARGVDTLVDGAHAPGQVPLALDALGAAYYTGNCHKWMCTPKGSAFLYVRPDRQAEDPPARDQPRTQRAAPGPEPLPARVRLHGNAGPEPLARDPRCDPLHGRRCSREAGTRCARATTRSRSGRAGCCASRSASVRPRPTSMLGSLATVPLPDARTSSDALPLSTDPIMATLWERYRIEVLASVWPASPQRVLRVSAQAYNEESQYVRLASALKEALAAGA